MISVYVWDYTGKSGNWGHASMMVGGRYFSWWPEGLDRKHYISDSIPIYTVRAIRSRSFAEDARAEGGPPNHAIRVTTLDEAKVVRFWRKLKSNPNAQWATLGQNCSTTVARALMAGGGDSKVKLGDWWHQWNVVWHPEDVRSYALAIRRGRR